MKKKYIFLMSQILKKTNENNKFELEISVNIIAE